MAFFMTYKWGTLTTNWDDTPSDVSWKIIKFDNDWIIVLSEI